jgi:hypothetical protein
MPGQWRNGFADKGGRGVRRSGITADASSMGFAVGAGESDSKGRCLEPRAGYMPLLGNMNGVCTA